MCKHYMALLKVKSCPWVERAHWPTLSIGSSQLLEKEKREKEEFPLGGVDLLVLGFHQWAAAMWSTPNILYPHNFCRSTPEFSLSL